MIELYLLTIKQLFMFNRIIYSFSVWKELNLFVMTKLRYKFYFSWISFFLPKQYFNNKNIWFEN